MSRKAIWGIIALMSLALLGIILLQVYWINWSIRLNADQFNKSVKMSLDNVSKSLEVEQRTYATNAGQLQLQRIEELYKELFVNTGFKDSSDVHTSATFGPREFSPYCNCSDCQRKRLSTIIGKIKVKNLMNPLPISELINVQKLGYMLKKELSNKGIDINYEYGVFSVDKNDFVIKNDHYVVVNEYNNNQVSGMNKRLRESGFRVSLFENNTQQPRGYLMIYFPGRSGFLWGTVWQTLAGAILFTSIILFSFVYAINTIFRQKKLSIIKNDFINNMTHEFKTPIATISLAADSITSPMIMGDTGKVRRFADIIKQENRRMNKQVERVLQMALLDKNEFALKLTEFDIHDIIQQAVSNTNLQAEQRDGRVTANLMAKRSIIEADMTHISNVVHNLLDNANKYSPDQPEIIVSTKDEGGGIAISVKDNGIGMNGEEKRRIFDRFYRVHTGDVHDIKGFGLGLSYVKAILEKHKGTISVKSEKGKGSKFTIFLPYTQDMN